LHLVVEEQRAAGGPPLWHGDAVTHTPPHWLTSRPADGLVADGLELRRLTEDDRDRVIAAVNASLDELRPWMPWAQQPATPASIGSFIQIAQVTWMAGTEFQFAMVDPEESEESEETGALIGCCGLHARAGPGVLEIGYWVRTDRTGRGVATRAAATLTRAALDMEEVHRVEIRCDATNQRSAAVPARLGYRLDRTEHRPPTAPGETDQHMIWALDR
jgi:RimJ/RimL family protein N-acetyltransferase